MAAASTSIWIGSHLLLYTALGLATLASLAAIEGDGPRSIVGSVLAAVVWGMPLHIAALLMATGALMFLRALSSLQWFTFRLVALGVFAVQALLLTLLIDRSESAALVGVFSAHLLMGLLLIRPRARWANADPSMAEHL